MKKWLAFETSSRDDCVDVACGGPRRLELSCDNQDVLPCLPNGSREIMIHRIRESSVEIRGF